MKASEIKIPGRMCTQYVKYIIITVVAETLRLHSADTIASHRT
jgi:hypothetical protein